MKPSNFTCYPWDSILQKSECETIAQNIMKILQRTGDKFRPINFKEYKIERIKDGNFSDREEEYFNQVIMFCTDSESALKFSSSWQIENKLKN
jgi:hypothetical protein